MEITNYSQEPLARQLRFLLEQEGLRFGENYTGDIASPTYGAFSLNTDKGKLRLQLNVESMMLEDAVVRVGDLGNKLLKSGIVNANINLYGSEKIDMMPQLRNIDALTPEKLKAYTELHGLSVNVINSRGELLKPDGKFETAGATYRRAGSNLDVEIDLAVTGQELEKKIAEMARSEYAALGTSMGFKPLGRLEAILGRKAPVSLARSA